MTNDYLIIILSLAAGVVGTGIGGALGVLFADRGSRVTGRVLGFAGGVMLGVVCFNMLPESLDGFAALGHAGAFAALGTLAAGMLAIFAINAFVNRLEHLRFARRGRKSEGRALLMGAILASRTVATQSASVGEKRGRRELMRAGVIMFVAIAMHNLPEGMAIGAAGAAQTSMGVLVAIVIAVHNIPEGMAIGAPLAGAGVKPLAAISLACLAGAATVVGAVVGLLLGCLGALATGICLALAGGAMLYVTLFDLFSEATSLLEGKLPSLSIQLGVMCAAAFVYAM